MGTEKAMQTNGRDLKTQKSTQTAEFFVQRHKKQMMLGKLDIHMWKTSLSPTLYKN
jgi:hypothetical protein